MKRLINSCALAIAVFSGWAAIASAHELTPTYLKPLPAYIDGVKKVTLTMFNRRDDIVYYEINVYDAEFNPIAFATSNRILKVPYLTRSTFDVYYKNPKDVGLRPVYFCTTSKILKDESIASTKIVSRVCSKLE